VRAPLALALALLVLLPSGCGLAGRSFGVYVDDKLVKSGVKRRLASERRGEPAVQVDTFGGTVYLSGTVDTAAEKAEAEIGAWQVDGVQQVVNDLVVLDQPPVWASPALGVQHPLLERLPGVERVEPGRPGGPDLAYDRNGHVVATVYTVVWRDLVSTGLSTLSASARPVHHVSTYALPERPDLPGPVYAIVLWHVSEPDAAGLR
jgi:hypothetical protein